MRPLLKRWYIGLFSVDSPVGGSYVERDSQLAIANMLRFSVSAVDPNYYGDDVSALLLEQAEWDEEFYLNLLDAALEYARRSGLQGDTGLEQVLDSGGSVWQVAADGASLERRVTQELTDVFGLATATDDSVTAELREAWANAYGRNGDPSDAWDHSIKALEAALIPVVVPKKAKPNLGDVLGILRANDGKKWRSTFPGKDDDNPVDQMVKTLEQIWPNIDRHQGVQPSRQPTEAEARSVVALTAALIQAHRESPLVYKV